MKWNELAFWQLQKITNNKIVRQMYTRPTLIMTCYQPCSSNIISMMIARAIAIAVENSLALFRESAKTVFPPIRDSTIHMQHNRAAHTNSVSVSSLHHYVNQCAVQQRSSNTSSKMRSVYMWICTHMFWLRFCCVFFRRFIRQYERMHPKCLPNQSSILSFDFSGLLLMNINCSAVFLRVYECVAVRTRDSFITICCLRLSLICFCSFFRVSDSLAALFAFFCCSLFLFRLYRILLLYIPFSAFAFAWMCYSYLWSDLSVVCARNASVYIWIHIHTHSYTDRCIYELCI